jgi:succinate-semialdehyde dehydrogenase/glutarate-semialdehyde dehydrogenase
MALKWRHAGQACITANRIYVQKGVYKEFTDLVAKKTKELKVGHGAKEGTTLGPLTTPRSIDKALQHVEDAKKNGAKILFGGNKVKIDDGYFFEPTIVLDAHDGLLLAQEEQFSPIAAFFPFETEEEVVKSANDTSMGLASYFFTKNVDRTWRLLENLEAGQIGMNTGNMSSAEIPFGGIKMSGYGKESGKDVAVEEYLITKTGVLSLEGHF